MWVHSPPIDIALCLQMHDGLRLGCTGVENTSFLPKKVTKNIGAMLLADPCDEGGSGLDIAADTTLVLLRGNG